MSEDETPPPPEQPAYRYIVHVDYENLDEFGVGCDPSYEPGEEASAEEVATALEATAALLRKHHPDALLPVRYPREAEPLLFDDACEQTEAFKTRHPIGSKRELHVAGCVHFWRGTILRYAGERMIVDLDGTVDHLDVPISSALCCAYDPASNIPHPPAVDDDLVRTHGEPLATAATQFLADLNALQRKHNLELRGVSIRGAVVQSKGVHKNWKIADDQGLLETETDTEGVVYIKRGSD